MSAVTTGLMKPVANSALTESGLTIATDTEIAKRRSQLKRLLLSFSLLVLSVSASAQVATKGGGGIQTFVPMKLVHKFPCPINKEHPGWIAERSCVWDTTFNGSPVAKHTSSGWCCPKPYWPFQSWTHQWSCVKGEFEAKSTWFLYDDPIIFAENKPVEIEWLIHASFTGPCKEFTRKDGLAHSFIAGVEYTQTCKDGELGLMTPVDPDGSEEGVVRTRPLK